MKDIGLRTTTKGDVGAGARFTVLGDYTVVNGVIWYDNGVVLRIVKPPRRETYKMIMHIPYFRCD